MAYQGRWRDEERYRPEERERFRWDAWRDEADHGRSVRDNPGYGRGSGRDYPEYYRTGGEPDRWHNPPGNDRDFMDRATDEVSSWFGDDEARRRRAMDAANDHRGRGPRGYVRSEARIREDVCDKLSEDPLVDATDIEVMVDGTEVTLAGTVETRRERRLAEDCAERVSGVTHVQNNLRVAREQAEGAGMPAPTPPFI